MAGSRSNLDTSVTIQKSGVQYKFDLPIFPANMKTVVNPETYRKYFNVGLIPMMHRFGISNVDFLNSIEDVSWKSISVGIKEDDHKELERIRNTVSLKNQPTSICIDVAHGDHIKVVETILLIKELYKNFDVMPIIIAGNVTTGAGYIRLAEAGADIIKVGIGGGSPCSTRYKTGFHVPMATAILECAKWKKSYKSLIIADGGIKHNGDIAKALVCGADFVMMGGKFAACSDSPAEISNGGEKIYFGSASEHNKGSYKNVEGFKVELTVTKSIEETTKEIKEDLQSSISYAGGENLKGLNSSRVNIVLVN
jgi:GMP reductase